MLNNIKAYKMGIAIGISFLLITGIAILVITQMVPKQINLTIDGNQQTRVTNSFTVDEFFQEEKIKIQKEDVVSVGSDKVINDGMEIKIDKAVPFTLQADGKSMDLKAVPKTVEEALNYHNIPVKKVDKVKPGLDEPLTEGMEITINRITFKTEVLKEPLDYKTKVTGTNDLPAGSKKVMQKGEKGRAEVTYRYTYSDGKLIKKIEIDRELVKKPETKIVAKSTRGTIAGAEYKKKFTVKAYSYSGGGRTAMGTPARVGAIAVDPKVIPLGTKVYVEGYGFARAEDTGGNIKGNTIDVYKNSSSESSSWGVRNVTIYIL